jgi:hypothetical protein
MVCDLRPRAIQNRKGATPKRLLGGFPICVGQTTIMPVPREPQQESPAPRPASRTATRRRRGATCRLDGRPSVCGQTVTEIRGHALPDLLPLPLPPRQQAEISLPRPFGSYRVTRGWRVHKPPTGRCRCADRHLQLIIPWPPPITPLSPFGSRSPLQVVPANTVRSLGRFPLAAHTNGLQARRMVYARLCLRVPAVQCPES